MDLSVFDVAAAIEEGQLDGSLIAIIDAVKERQRTLSRRVARSLTPGDTVRFSSTIRPKYLVGKTATVVRVNRESVVVTCPDDLAYGRFSNAKNVRCPNSLIEGAV